MITKYYTENQRLRNVDPSIPGVDSGAAEG